VTEKSILENPGVDGEMKLKLILGKERWEVGGSIRLDKDIDQ
jgi:hypothetical protein